MTWQDLEAQCLAMLFLKIFKNRFSRSCASRSCHINASDVETLTFEILSVEFFSCHFSKSSLSAPTCVPFTLRGLVSLLDLLCGLPFLPSCPKSRKRWDWPMEQLHLRQSRRSGRAARAATGRARQDPAQLPQRGTQPSFRRRGEAS